MCVRSLSLLLVAALGAQAQWRFQPPKPEGEVCGRIRDQEWTCQRESVCASLAFLASRGRRITCNTDQEERVTCCPSPEVEDNRGADTISERKCLEYQAIVTCPSRVGGDLVQSFPGLVAEEDEDSYGAYEEGRTRRKREESGEEMMEEGNIFLNEDDPEEDTTEVTILNGRLAKPKELPHSALIGYGPRSAITWACGGTLVSDRYVLSAAHCSFDGGSMGLGPARWVRLGDLDYASSSDDQYAQNFFIIQRYDHPAYNNNSLYNDIALFRLDRAAVFNEYVAPACLHTSTSNPFGLATASGYGKTGINTPTNTVLRVVDLGFIRCNDGLKEKVNGQLPFGVDHQTMICAWRDQKDACRGDSGGPLILADWQGSCLPRLVGITSFGPQCEPSEKEDAGVYSRVAAFRPWIESIVWPDAYSNN